MKIYYKGRTELLVGDAQNIVYSKTEGKTDPVALMSPIYLIPGKVTQVTETDSVIKSRQSGILFKLEEKGLINIYSDNEQVFEETDILDITKQTTNIPADITNNKEVLTGINQISNQINNLSDNINKLVTVLSDNKKESKPRGRPKGSKNKVK